VGFEKSQRQRMILVHDWVPSIISLCRVK